MTNIILWKRVSSEEQGKKYSLEAQDKELKEYCKKYNKTILKEFISKTSGFKWESEEFQLLLDYIEKNYKNIDEILFTERDRLLRDPEIGGYIKYTCLSKQIQLIAINEDIKANNQTESQEMFDSIALIFAKFENKRKTRRTMRGKNVKFEIKKQHIGKAPFGYSNVKTNDIMIPQPNSDAITVQNMFDDYINGLGYLKLAKKYNILYKGSGGFATITIKNMLHNPFYIGYITRTKDNKKEIIKGNHTSIIKEEIFYKIRGNERWNI